MDSPRPKLTHSAWLDVAAIVEAAGAPRLPLDEWAAKYRRVVGGAHAGQWNNRTVPMAVEPMQAVSDHRVKQVTLCSPAQLMKSEFAINVAIWTAAHGQDVLFYEPDREVLAEFVRDRMRPAVFALESGAIVESADARFLKKRDSALVIRLAGGGKILGLTPQMKTGKSAYTAPVVVLDELDKMGDTTMITVARSRTITYGQDAKIVSVSTPTVDQPGTIWRLWQEGSRGRWHGRCRHCGESGAGQLDPSARVRFESDEDGFWLPDGAAMFCDLCGVEWTESDRQLAIRGGAYVHDKPDNPHRTFHVPGPAHVFASLRDMVVEGADVYRDARQDGTLEKYQMFVNDRQGEVWSDEYYGLSARRMARTTYSLGARGKNDLGELDPRTVLITAGSDVHGRDIRTEFVAWGVDPKTGLTLGWGLQYRILGGAPDDDIEDPELWRQYFKLIDSSVWRHPAYPGQTIGAHRAFIDAGYRSDMVRDELGKRFLREIEQGSPGYRESLRRQNTALPRAQSAALRRIYRHVGGDAQIIIGSCTPSSGDRRLAHDDDQGRIVRDQATGQSVAGGCCAATLAWPVDLEARGYTP